MSELALNCWEENVAMLKQLAKDDGLDYEATKLHTDCNGNTLFKFRFKGIPSRKTLNYYHKNRVRK